jgi:RNA polymerase-binding transcription factor DksA
MGAVFPPLFRRRQERRMMETQELESYKSRLVEMRARLIDAVGDLQQGIRETLNPPGENSLYHTHQADMGASGASGLDREIILTQNEAGILRQVEAALERIEAGTFGLCEECQRAIHPERLDAIPYTPYCLDCAGRVQAEEGEPGMPSTPFDSEE